MKKSIFFVLFALCAGPILNGCRLSDVNWSEYSYYVWDNNSSHKITLSVESGYHNPQFENLVLNPEGKHEEMVSGALISPGTGWKITVLFDDGTYGAEFYWHWETDENGDGSWKLFPDGYDERYNPAIEENYVSEEVKNPNGCLKCPGFRWMYTFTDADYNAAVEYGERTVGRESAALAR